MTEDATYTDTPTHVRIFDEGNQWTIDGADSAGRYTRDVWSFDTHAEAVAGIPEYVRFMEHQGYVFEWRNLRNGAATD